MKDKEFDKRKIEVEDGFWAMYYFLRDYHVISDGNFGVADILNLSKPKTFRNSEKLLPSDRSIIKQWNEAVRKVKEEGIPIVKNEEKYR